MTWVVVLLLALSPYARTLAADPEEQQLLLAAVPLIERGDFDRAEQQLLDGLKVFPKSAMLQNALGIVYEKQGKPDRATAAFEAALRELPAFTAAQLHLAALYQQGKKTRDAAELFAAAGNGTTNYEAIAVAAAGLAECEDYQRAAALFEKADRIRPGSASIAYNLALARYKGRQYQGALEAIGSPALTSERQQPELLYLRGKVREALGQPAQEDLSAACRLRPASEAFCLDAAVRLIRDEKFADAVEALTRSLTDSPSSVPLLGALGLAQFRLGRYQESIRSYERALQIDPALDAAREGLGFLLFITGDLDKGRAVVEQGLKKPGADFYLWQLEAMLIHRQAPQMWAEARDAVNRALEKNPRFAPSYFLRGKIEMSANRLDAALADFDRAASLDPNYPLPYYRMAQIYWRQGKDREASAARERFNRLGSLREEEILTRQAQDLLMPAASR